MKVDFTVVQYEKAFGNSAITSYFRSVVQRMPVKVKEILESSKERYVTGEIALWDLLTSKKVNPELAAEISLVFPPDPIYFDPGIVRSEDLREKFDANTQNGHDPLEVLVEIAALALNKSFIHQPNERLEIFKRQLKKLKDNIHFNQVISY